MAYTYRTYEEYLQVENKREDVQDLLEVLYSDELMHPSMNEYEVVVYDNFTYNFLSYTVANSKKFYIKKIEDVFLFTSIVNNKINLYEMFNVNPQTHLITLIGTYKTTSKYRNKYFVINTVSTNAEQEECTDIDTVEMFLLVTPMSDYNTFRDKIFYNKNITTSNELLTSIQEIQQRLGTTDITIQATGYCEDFEPFEVTNIKVITKAELQLQKGYGMSRRFKENKDEFVIVLQEDI